MQQQSLDTAISTELLLGLCHTEDEPKFTLRDLLASSGQVATALSACWVVHLFV